MKQFLFFVGIVLSIGIYSQESNLDTLSIDYSIKAKHKSNLHLVLHFTVGDNKSSLEELQNIFPRQVSINYLVCDSSWNYKIYSIVPESEEAHHAGISSWHDIPSLNYSSIGIEIVNPDGNRVPFNLKQIDIVKKLCLNILSRNPQILPTNVVGHSDIAPDRKDDPGTLFPWFDLYKEGIGAWYNQEDVDLFMKDNILSVMEQRKLLHKYGYNISLNSSEIDIEFNNVVIAFQRHFRPKNIDGVMDKETISILRALCKKYF